MKLFKQLLCATLALFVCACTIDEEPLPDVAGGSYSGVLTVATPMGTTANTDGIVFDLDLNKEAETLTLTLNAVAFAPGMPEQTMSVADVPYTESAGVITIEATNVVPSIGNLPYEKYTFTALNGTITNKDMAVEIACAGFTISFAGTK